MALDYEHGFAMVPNDAFDLLMDGTLTHAEFACLRVAIRAIRRGGTNRAPLAATFVAKGAKVGKVKAIQALDKLCALGLLEELGLQSRCKVYGLVVPQDSRSVKARTQPRMTAPSGAQNRPPKPPPPPQAPKPPRPPKSVLDEPFIPNPPRQFYLDEARAQRREILARAECVPKPRPQAEPAELTEMDILLGLGEPVPVSGRLQAAEAAINRINAEQVAYRGRYPNQSY
jgi:hypothetical protein